MTHTRPHTSSTEKSAPTTSARLKPKVKVSDACHCDATTAKSASASEPTSVSMCAASVMMASECAMIPVVNSTNMKMMQKMIAMMSDSFARAVCAISCGVGGAANRGDPCCCEEALAISDCDSSTIALSKYFSR